MTPHRTTTCQQARLSAGLLAVALLLVPACRDRTPPRPDQSAEPNCAHTGTLVATAGHFPNADHLVRVTLCPFTVTTISAGGAFVHVSGAGDHVVVSGSQNIAGADTVWQLNGSELQRIPGVGDTPASLPAVNASGRIAFKDRSGPADDTVIKLLDNRDDLTADTIYTTDERTSSLFWEGDRLFLLRVPGATLPRTGDMADAELLQIWPTQTSGRTLTFRWSAGVIPGPDGRLALVRDVPDSQPSGDIIDTDNTARQVPDGWYPLCFDTTAALLVSNSKTSEVGVATPPTYSRITTLGTSPVGRLWYASCLP